MVIFCPCADVQRQVSNTLRKQPLPPGTRARFYAGVELALDLAHALRTPVPDWDLETLLICLTISEAAMRPLIVGSRARPDLLDDPCPPDSARGAISRRLIADRCGLPRETVRRKVNFLIEAGVVVETENGELRPIANLDDPAMQTLALEILQAVRRYERRLRSLGYDELAPQGNNV